MIDDTLGYYNLIKENHISLIYNGPIWSEVVEDIGVTLRKRLEIDDLPLSISQSVFSVFVEQMYNIVHYSAEREHFFDEDSGKEYDVASGIFILGAEDKKYFIQCGNKIRPDQMPLIRDRINHLNTLDKPGLRKFYKERLKAEDSNPESKGAGIGLIEIARRASSKMEYRFEPLDDSYCFFTLYVTIG